MVDTIELNWMNEVGGACNTYEKQECCTEGVLRERVHLENLGINERIILNCIFKKWDAGMDWIHLA
jgi:hypothetical protein